MKSLTITCLAFALLALPAVVSAGQIYGTIVLDGQGVKSVAIEVECGKDEPVKGTTAADGSYRINVAAQGQCTLRLPSYEGRPSAAIFSGPNPAAYNYELVKLADGKYELEAAVTTDDTQVPQPDLPRDHSWGRTGVDLIKALALPLVTLVLGYWFNSSLNERQQVESNIRLYAEMMGRREEADSNLRKDMFNSILTNFLARDPSLRLSSEELIRQQILSLELLAYNFHESLDIGPLFKDVQRRIGMEKRATNDELRGRLESVSLQVIEHQLTALSDAGSIERGDALPEKINDLQAYLMFGTKTVPDPDIKPGEGTARVCLSMKTNDGSTRFRQFKLELLRYDEVAREVQVHLYVSQPLTAEECQQPTLDLQAKREIDTNFVVGLFDFPMIDNTRLSGGERTAVSLTALNPSVLSVALTYFPASRASLKDKPYYDEVIRDLVRNRQPSSPLR